jgi:hypothetical protein
MCLSRVTKRIKKRTLREVFAFKEFHEEKEQLYFKFYSVNGEYAPFVDRISRVERGVWLKSKETELTAGAERYLSGFHAYKCDDSRTKVKLRLVHTYGEQDNELVLVAAEMYVPKERKKKK